MPNRFTLTTIHIIGENRHTCVNAECRGLCLLEKLWKESQTIVACRVFDLTGWPVVSSLRSMRRQPELVSAVTAMGKSRRAPVDFLKSHAPNDVEMRTVNACKKQMMVKTEGKKCKMSSTALRRQISHSGDWPASHLYPTSTSGSKS